jgi:hypothetical protein
MRICKKHIVRFIVIFTILLLAACGSQPGIRVEVLPRYDALFENKNGWTGADGAYSVALADAITLWLFGDTWFGEIRNGKHVNATIINNTVAVQHGLRPPDVSVKFYAGKKSTGAPQAFIRPVDGRGWFWIFHGALASDGLYLFLLQIDRTDAPMSFGFEVIGSWLGHIANFRDPPVRWKISQHKLPWAKFSAAGNTFFGSWVLKKNEFFYIYGIDEVVVDHIPRKYMVLARAPEAGLAHFDQWRFYTGGNWTADFNGAERLCANMANEYSVSFQPIVGKYAAVYSENGISRNIVARLAPNPWGPWSEPDILYQCPEMSRSKDILCYAAKGHPDLSSAPDELIITYVANSNDFYKMAGDARLYRPRFLRVWFE